MFHCPSKSVINGNLNVIFILDCAQKSSYILLLATAFLVFQHNDFFPTTFPLTWLYHSYGAASVDYDLVSWYTGAIPYMYFKGNRHKNSMKWSYFLPQVTLLLLFLYISYCIFYIFHILF